MTLFFQSLFTRMGITPFLFSLTVSMLGVVVVTALYQAPPGQVEKVAATTAFAWLIAAMADAP